MDENAPEVAPEPLRVIPCRDRPPEELLHREWLLTNGLGGYASGTLVGAVTRRYHGYLVASLPAPLGRVQMLNHLSETLRLPDGRLIQLGGVERVGNVLELHGLGHLSEFRLEAGLPVWRFDFEGYTLERRVVLPHLQNTVHVTWRLVAGEGTLRLKLRPAVHFRGHDAPVNAPLNDPYTIKAVGPRYEIHGPEPIPPLRLQVVGERASFTLEEDRLVELLYRVEEARGYDSAGELWSPGVFRADLRVGHDVTLVASTEPWDTFRALSPEAATHAEGERRRKLLDRAPEAARVGIGAELVLAADQFIVLPGARAEEAARARAAGDEARTVIAGYHWFTDWGRDTMISLEGLTLATGRHREAGAILRTFATHVRDGLIPNMFPDGANEGLYHTADATMWFFHAIDRYVAWTRDTATLGQLLPVLRDIARRHLAGTRFGIHVDPADGLLCQGAPGYQLTWMDAKCDGWVVTPRRGKAVEINALWYNALRLLERWDRDAGEPAAEEWASHAERARQAFNARFWNDAGYLYDVVDGEGGDDDSFRPNQVLAVSLPNPVLDPARWAPVVHAVRDRLLTPVGLRSLAPGHPDYHPSYHGDLCSRDAAYHQGTVWTWLIGPFLDAWRKVHPEDHEGARRFLSGCVAHLSDFGVGTIAEIFDAEPPFSPRGCIAQAWSVAEVLRNWVLEGG